MKDLEKMFKALADKNRIRIIKLLQRRPMCVCELAYILGVTQPAVSRHLKKLGAAGLVASAQDGFWTNYHLRKADGYAGRLLKDLQGRLDDDTDIVRDAGKIKHVNRTELCRCKRKERRYGRKK
ncbi:hypothetical protein BU251_06415 [Candidatus Velamenicoccus archaeovorus]|uniref:HTH arsR-type domain-containing protein n=1 Tax=Velamenicoccus archaeovorus TaxID=1930593 RepID=A0A410P5L6_VELA1|nr:metalloregulator ArsR/SmtB family transcription factor [Candidatus Velamenicoccus archaeovorus]QAT17382.1 hypothetical protein BU251_06415 [Candidatus Velamenicoccus archaeovorus]